MSNTNKSFKEKLAAEYQKARSIKPIVLVNIKALANITNELIQIQNVFDDLNLTALDPTNHVFHERYKVQPNALSVLGLKLLRNKNEVKILLDAEEIEGLSDQMKWVNDWFGNFPCIVNTDIDVLLSDYIIYPENYFLCPDLPIKKRIILGSNATPNWATVVAKIQNHE